MVIRVHQWLRMESDQQNEMKWRMLACVHHCPHAALIQSGPPLLSDLSSFRWRQFEQVMMMVVKWQANTESRLKQTTSVQSVSFSPSLYLRISLKARFWAPCMGPAGSKQRMDQLADTWRHRARHPHDASSCHHVVLLPIHPSLCTLRN